MLFLEDTATSSSADMICMKSSQSIRDRKWDRKDIACHDWKFRKSMLMEDIGSSILSSSGQSNNLTHKIDKNYLKHTLHKEKHKACISLHHYSIHSDKLKDSYRIVRQNQKDMWCILMPCNIANTEKHMKDKSGWLHLCSYKEDNCSSISSKSFHFGIEDTVQEHIEYSWSYFPRIEDNLSHKFDNN